MVWLPEITTEVVELAIRRLQFVGDYVRLPKARFEYARDPRDEKFIEVAIGLKATHILSSDRDLLSLPVSQSDAGRRFRQRLPETQILDPGNFMQVYGNAVLRGS